MQTVIVICVLTALHQSLDLLSDWENFSIKKRVIKGVAITLLLVITANNLIESDKSTNKIVDKAETSILKIDTIAVLVDSIKQLNKVLIEAERNLFKIQTERHNEVVGGDSPPTLRIESSIYPIAYLKYGSNGRVIIDSTAYHLLLTFCFINESPYYLKSTRVSIDYVDLLNQNRYFRGTYKEPLGPFGMMKFNNQHEAHEFNTLPPGLVKRFSVKVPLEKYIALNTGWEMNYSSYQFNLSVEWSNGYYSTQIRLKSNKTFNPIQYKKDPEAYVNDFKIVSETPKFKTLPGRKIPKYIFVQLPGLQPNLGELRND